MYFNMFGGSALLHLLAGHPRVIAAFGIAATVTMLVTPLGPGKQVGSEGYASAVDRTIHTVEDNEIRQIASELRLEHADFIAARSAHVEHLQVLKKETT